jgi:hypothetical protein
VADKSTPDSPASDTTKKANGQGRDDASFGRTTLPYVIAALLAAVAMAWYFFVFVPSKLDYFVGLRFRTLAVASGHVASKVDNLARAFGSVPNSPPPREDGSCVPQTDEQRAERARYVALVLPEVRLQSAAGGPQFVACDVSGSVAWSDVAIQAAEASRRDFDDLLIADGDGDVVWQREMSTPRIGNLSELLGVPDDEGSWWSISWRERATVPAKKNVENLRSSAVLKVVNLGGTSSLLLVQAVALTDRSITLSGDPAVKTADRAQLYVAGLVSRAGLQQQARRIPAAWVVLIALPIMLLFLAIPFVKLATLTINERYRFSDVVLVILSTVAASGLGAMIPFVSAPPSAPDATLERLATAVNESLKNETAEVLKLADVILANRPQIEAQLHPCDALGSGLQTAPNSATSGKQECGLWEAIGAAVPSEPARSMAVDLDVVIWFDEIGNQIRKWTTKRQVTGRTSHRPFDHYRAASTNQLWTMVGGGSSRRFMIDPLRAPTTAELGVVFVTPAPEIEGEEKSFFALNVRPQSVVDPIVPPGYGFAIIAPTGKVLFHSDEGLSLQENFFEEVGDPREVRERARANRVVHWSGDYHGRPHRFRLQPMQAFRDSPWFIITFHEVGPVLSREILQQTGAVRFGGLNLFLLVVVALGFAGYSRLKHRRARDLMQTLLAETPTATGRVWVLLVLLVIEVVAISLTYGVTAGRRLDTVYATFVAIPVAALFVVLLARRWREQGVVRSGGKRVEQPNGQSDAPVGRWDWRKLASHAELGILALLIGALPAIAFARIVHVAQETRGTEELLEAAQRQWTARQARMQERINGPNYTQALRNRLTKEFGAAEYAASGRYTYLNVLSSLNVVEDAAGDPPGRYDGQYLVRRLLDSNVFSSRDEAVDAKVQREIASHVLRVEPGASAGTGDTVDGRSAQLSGIGVSLGLFILAASLSGVYWVRRRLQSHGAAAAAPSLESTIAKAREREPHTRSHAAKGPVIVLLIGPARTGKDDEVRRVVQAATGAPPIERIKLLDDKDTVDAAYLEKAVATVASTIHERARCVGAAQTFWIHVSNLETQLVDVASRARILKVLDRLVHGNGGQRRCLVVTSSVDPIEHFEEIFQEERKGIYVNPVPEVALNRSVLILSYFRRCYMPISSHHDRLRRCRDAWDSWWRYDPKQWKDTLAAEVNGYLPLEHVRDELELTWAHRKEVPFDELLRTIRARASAYYELLWTSCTRSEKLVLIQLAQEGFVTTQSADVVAPLIAKGIIVERPTPAIFNRTFRDFLVGIERNDVIQRWERGEGHGLWLVSGRLIGSSLIAGVLFFLLTQDVSVQSLLPVISGTGLFGIPLVRAILARLSGKAPEIA